MNLKLTTMKRMMMMMKWLLLLLLLEGADYQVVAGDDAEEPLHSASFLFILLNIKKKEPNPSTKRPPNKRHLTQS